MKTRLVGIFIMLGLILLLAGVNLASASSGFSVDGQAVTCGGGTSWGEGNLMMQGSLGWGFSGASSGGGYTLTGGVLLPGSPPINVYLPLVAH